jgi:hypothetical protein
MPVAVAAIIVVARGAPCRQILLFAAGIASGTRCLSAPRHMHGGPLQKRHVKRGAFMQPCPHAQRAQDR